MLGLFGIFLSGLSLGGGWTIGFYCKLKYLYLDFRLKFDNFDILLNCLVFWTGGTA